MGNICQLSPSLLESLSESVSRVGESSLLRGVTGRRLGSLCSPIRCNKGSEEGALLHKTTDVLLLFNEPECNDEK